MPVNVIDIHCFISTFSGDFIYMCRQLNMEDMAEEIMDQLGLQSQSKITFQDFLRFRGQVTKLSYYLKDTNITITVDFLHLSMAATYS